MIQLTIVLSLLIAPLILAQENTGTRKTSVRVSCLGPWKKGPLFILNRDKAQSKSTTHQIEILDMGYSPAIPHKRGQPVEFIKETGNTKKPYELVLKAIVPDSVKSPLILLIPIKGKIAYRVFDLDPSKFPFGSCQMVNYSSQKLTVAIDTDVQRLPPAKTHIFPAVNTKTMNAWIRVGIKNTGKLVFSSMTTRRANKRVIIFFINGQDGELITTRILVDFKPVAKNKP